MKTIITGVRNEQGAFIEFFDSKEGYQLVAPAVLGATPGPVVAQNVWQLLMDSLLDGISAQEKVDGILLALHGAMVTEEFEDAEGEILQRLCSVVGADVPIMITLDLHVNMTEKMMRNTDAFFVYDYYPHTDSYATGMRAAECMFKTLDGIQKPVMPWNKMDLILPYMPTHEPVFLPFLTKAQQLRDSGQLINVSICHGFFASDIYEQVMAVVAVADGDALLAQRTAD